MIPEEKQAAVERALQEAFGVAECEDICMLTAGLSTALVLRVIVRGCPYLLRIITRTDAMNDPTRQFVCMKSSAEAGLAPRVWYASVEDRLAITDFVPARPFPLKEALARLPLTLRAVHALPHFPKSTHNYVDVRNGFIKKFQTAKILPESETAEIFELYAQAAGVYPHNDSQMVSCHNDLKPENVLFDGERVWLVDWEAAFLNDRYIDLVVVANFVVTNEADEESFLRAYFGEAPSEYRLARFYLMRQLVNMFYVAMFLLLGSSGKPVEANAEVPDFREFHERIWAGAISLAGPEAKIQYGMVHLKQVLQDMRAPRFQEALRIVAGGHAGA